MNVRNRYLIFVLSLLLLGSTCVGELWAAGPVSIRGKVTAREGPLEGAYIGAHARGKTLTTYVMTDSSGQFTFHGLAAGSYTVFTRTPGFRAARKDSVAVQAGR